jgi:hypothetical protein
MDSVKPAGPDAVANRFLAEAGFPELGERDRAVLPSAFHGHALVSGVAFPGYGPG